MNAVASSLELDLATRGEAPGASCVFKGCRGVFHPGSGSLGVVLCAPWGEEAFRGGAAWARLAATIAAAGYPCLRFDYRGTGDSSAAMNEIEDVADWVGTIDSASDFLRAYSGVKTFVFVGQGLGAGLAMQAAGLRADVVGLVLMAPVAHGRGFLGGLGVTRHGGPVSFGGFTLGARLVESLKTFDATKAALGGLTQATVFDRADRKAGAEVSEFYKRNGIVTRFAPFASGASRESDAGKEAWSEAAAAVIVETLRAIKPVAPALKTPRVPLLPATLRAGDFREEPLMIESGTIGIVCRSSQPGDGALFVFLNEEATTRIGWGRTFVDQARALAARGVSTLRLDPLSPDAMGRVIDAMEARGFTRIGLVGIGVAATTALMVASADRRIASVVAVNPPRLVGEQPEQKRAPAGWARAWRFYAATMPTAWANRLAPVGRAVLAFGAPRVGAPPSSQGSSLHVKALFASLSNRGARVSLVYGDTDLGLRALRLAFGPLGRDLTSPGTSVSIMPGADPKVTNPLAAAMLRDHLVALGQEASGDPGERRHAA